ncbi:SdrD B-like domain-containing protein, partial [Gilliamella sp. Choc6-1]|uniref:SdrD B-like domain-containing protein n=1 Tax=Gilliamella sp. Choc6-1 TaxID=3120239 RepID=UPI001146D1E9
MDSWQSIEIGKIIPQVKKNLRISGEEIMRTEHNAAVEMKAKSSRKTGGYGQKSMFKCAKGLLASTFISLMTISAANAFPVSGTVYLDYDNTATKTEMPLIGLKVELYDDKGKLVSNSETDGKGKYTLEAPALTTYKIVAKTDKDEVVEDSVSLIADTGESKNLFLKGAGGDIQLSIKDDKGIGAKNIPVKFINSAVAGELEMASKDNGIIEIKNTLKEISYTAVIDVNSFIEDISNAKKYALWDATLPDNTHGYVDSMTFNMDGAKKIGAFNIKERNEWGIDGIVAIDQDNDGIYSADIDTGAIGMNVELYYPGTTTKVLGTKTITTKENGKYHFENLAVESYDIKVTNVAAPYIPVGKMEAKVTISNSTALTSGPDFLLQIDPNDTKLPSISGYVFVLSEQHMPMGPDSGASFNTLPAANSIYFETPVELYQHDGMTWKKIATQKSNKKNGLYQFRGLASGKDYKVVLKESGIDLNKYAFVNDTDGKSSSTSPESKSRHKGRVTLSNGKQDNIGPREITIPSLGQGIKSNQNFWYSQVRSDLGMLKIVSNMATANNRTSWGGGLNGISTTTASTYMKVSFYEEDGVTPAIDSKGKQLVGTHYTPGYYGKIGYMTVPVDRAGIYVYKIDETNDGLIIDRSTSDYVLTILPGKSQDSNIIFKPEKPNTISGYIYLNNSHPGTTGNYDPNVDIPISAARVLLYRKLPNGNYNLMTEFGTNSDGFYNLTNLTDGEYKVYAKPEFGGPSNVGSNDVELENNDQGTGVQNNLSVIELNISGGKVYNTNTNFWYKLKQQDYVIRGSVHLDTNDEDGKNKLHLTRDLLLFDATVLLCRDGNEDDCIVGGKNYIAHQITDKSGEFKFIGSRDGIHAGVNYMIKALRSGTTAVTNSSEGLESTYIVKFDKLGPPIIKNFLMQGVADINAYPVNDLDGDRKLKGLSTSENGSGKFEFYYWDGSTYQEWKKGLGNFFNSVLIRNLPQGKYRITHNKGGNYIDIADMDPVTPEGTLDFEVLADGTFANGLTKEQYFMQASLAASGVSEGVSGKIYLDITGSGKIGEAVILTEDELTNYNKGVLSVEGIFTPRIYPGYFTGSVDSILSNPDFIDNEVQKNGGFAYTKANSTRGNLYLTNMLLQLKGLDTNQFELVANSSQPKESYLPDNIKNSLEYMQVMANNSGVPNQYWLLKLKNNTQISGQLYYDIDDNGIFEADKNDVPISGVKVELYRKGILYSYTKTDEQGKYTFKNLFDDTYTVKVTDTGLDKSRYELKSSSDSANDIKISPTTPSVSGSDLDFIYKKNGDAAITGNIMVDINNNGRVDINFDKTGDIALPGVSVKLYKNAVTDTKPYRQVETNDKGYYSFSGIDLNTTYIVEVVLPEGYGVISNADNNTNTSLAPIMFADVARTEQNRYFLLAGNSNTNPSAGINSSEAKDSGISGKAVVDDTDSEKPIADILIGLIDANGNMVARQKTNSEGEYHFYNLVNGKYSINVVTSPEGYSLIRNSKGTTQPLDTLSDIQLANKGEHKNNFYYKEASVNGISGNIYVDFNDSNNLKDLNNLNTYAHLLDRKIKATVELHKGLDGKGELLLSKETVNGTYQFSNLLFGDTADYSVVLKMDTLPDYNFKLSKAGTNSKDIVIPIEKLPRAGSSDNHYLVVGKQQIGGHVWIDINGDKVQDSDEGISGINVTLKYKPADETEYVTLSQTQTSNTGEYLFNKLPKNGNYQVVVSSPTGTALIPDSEITGNSDVYTYSSLQDNELKNSTAYKYIGEVSGHISIDVDNSQNKTAVDANLAGVKLILTNKHDNTIVKKVTVDNDGNFTADNLPLGDWVITTDSSQSVNDWSGYQLSYTENGGINTAATAKDLSLTVTLSDKQPNVNRIEIGYSGSSVIKGYVVLDIDNDGKYSADDIGLGEITPKLKLTSATQTSEFVDREITVDKASGYFEVTGLSQHDYELVLDDNDITNKGYKLVFSPNKTTPDMASNTAVFKVSGPKDDSFSKDTIAENQAFGYTINRAISGTVYLDVAGIGADKGHQDFNPVLVGAEVKAEATINGKKLTRVEKVDNDGKFTLPNIINGEWIVSVSHPTRVDLIYSYFVKKAVTPNKESANGISYNVDASTATTIELDLGMRGQSNISGKIVYDNDTSGDLSAADTGVEGLTVVLGNADDKTQSYLSVSTNSQGEFHIANLAQHDYTIKVTDPLRKLNGYELSFSPNGKSEIETLKVSSDNTDLTGQNFGYQGNLGISGHVYQDILGNGIHDATNYPLLPEVEITAVSVSNSDIHYTVKTDSTGKYSFDTLVQGKWKVSVTKYPSGWQYSYVDFVSQNPITNNGAGEVTVEVTPEVLVRGTGYSIDFGAKGSAQISGRVVIDMDTTDGNSVMDIDQPLVNIPVRLKMTGAAGSGQIEVKTDAKGQYRFEGLTAYDKYEVEVDDNVNELQGYEISFSPNDPANKRTAVDVATVTAQVTNVDYGYKGQGSLVGTIYRDYAGKGVHADYFGTLADVKVSVKNVSNNAIVLTAVSDANGHYQIEHMAAGKWQVSIEPPTGYDFSYVGETQGSTSTSVASGVEIELSATAKAKVDFGVKGQASISGQVVIDVDPDDGQTIVAQDIGIDTIYDNYAVELYVDEHLVNSAEVKTSGSDVAGLGQYRFENLSHGIDYQVKVKSPGNSYISSFMLTDTTITPSTNQTDNEMSETYQFAQATDKVEGASFAWKGNAGISGKIYLDKDDDGIYTAETDSSINEVVTVTLTNEANPEIQVIRTIEAGEISYEVENIIPGKWNIVVSGVPTTLTASFDPDDAHHNADGSLKTPQTVDMATVEVVGNLTDQNFGYINGGVIEGKLVEDSAGTGLIGLANYPGLSGVNVYLLDSNEKHVMDKAGKPMLSTTDNEGKFSFRNLAIGSHDGNSITHNIRVLYGEYNDGVVSSDSNSPLYEKVPFFEKYTDIGG